jgi:hypothetical protein
MDAFEAVDIASEAFALRLANLLVATRTRNGLGVAAVARASEGQFSRDDLKKFEHGGRTLDEQTIDELAQLYRCDLGVILPMRLPVVVSARGVSAGGVEEPFEGEGPEALLTAYLTLVRTLRRQKKAPVVDLRHDDVDVLAGFLQEPPATVVHQLATLMNATQAKRTALLGVLASGAIVLGLVGTAVAVGGSDTATPATPDTETTVVTDTTVPAPDTTVVDTPAVDITVQTTDAPQSTVAVTEAPTTTINVPPPTPATTTRPIVVPTVAPTTTFALVDTDLTTTTTIVSIDGPPIP